MALSQSALSELLDAIRAGGSADVIRDAMSLILQQLIELEADQAGSSSTTRWPKVPADLMARAVGFFRAIYRLHRTEAAVILVWRDSGFDLVVPAQKVSSVSVRFDLAGGDLPAGSRLVGSMHSHGGFIAYASSIDEDDEAELESLHIVVGDFDRRRLGYSAANVVDGIRFHLKTGQLIERPRRLAEPPDDWLQKMKLAPPPRPKALIDGVTDIVGGRQPETSARHV